MSDNIPVYLFLGFLESGKTSFIQDTLGMDYFLDGEKTLVVACENGVVPYDGEILKEANASVEMIRKREDLNMETLQQLQVKYHPDRVILEYNGMWSVPDLIALLDGSRWEIYQVITLVDSSTFDLYLANMRSLAVEMFKVSEMVIFNRATADTKRGMYRRGVKAVNATAQIGFESADGLPLPDTEDDLPYDVKANPIKVEDPDYGVFHIDLMEHPERYENKVVEFKANVFIPKGLLKNRIIVPGRKAMTCCAEDIQFIGYVCKLDRVLKNCEPKEGDWVLITARVASEFRVEYNGKGPVFYAVQIEKTTMPDEEIVTF